MNTRQAESYFDVLIVGGGMVGCTLACLLNTHPHTTHLKVAVVEADEQEPEISNTHFDARVVALSNLSRSILVDIDAWAAIAAQRLCAYKEMYVWDGEGTADVHFSSYDIREQQLGFIIENAVVLKALREKLSVAAQTVLFKPSRVKDLALASNAEDVQSVTLISGSNETTLHAALVVAADGAHSSVRTLLNMPTREWDYGHTAIITTVECEQEHKLTAWQRFTSSGPLAFLPLSDDLNANKPQRYCSLVWSAETQLAAKLKELNDAAFCEQLGRAFEFKLGKILHTDSRYALPLRQRHAESYVRPGLALAGDAAHTIHPLAGQGVNLGLYDVKVLAEEIARSQQREFLLTDYSILQRYQRRRQSHNLLAMATMEGFKHLFASQDLAVRWMRNTGMRFFNQQAWLKNKLIRLASG